MTSSRLTAVRAVALLGLATASGLGALHAAIATPLSYGGMTVPEVGLTRRIMTDPVSGVALNGYDPVAYFARGEAVHGTTENQAIWGGAAWRFENAGNRAAFEAHPEVYAPRFGGYDAEAMAGGRAVDADPAIFALREGRLYLFRTPVSRSAFMSSANRLTAAASGWSAVEPSLVE